MSQIPPKPERVAQVERDIRNGKAMVVYGRCATKIRAGLRLFAPEGCRV